jgi:hypothetical protein
VKVRRTSLSEKIINNAPTKKASTNAASVVARSDQGKLRRLTFAGWWLAGRRPRSGPSTFSVSLAAG